MDRRKRILRDNLPTDDESTAGTGVRARPRRAANEEGDESDEPQRRRSAGYSQNVRSACQHRLVQLIPVRRRAYLVAAVASVLIPAILLITHYLIYVNGYLRWYGHPLSQLLDASHPRGIAAWLSGQIWLLCLASTVLTFSLRRHKLDDYNGEYRLWFWLVSTCIIGSLDSTTRVIDLFGDALDRWSNANLGWSGDAVVQATLAMLVGMLGVRLCSELKSVPTSLVFWLIGLVAWAGSAALSQSMLKLDMSIQFRIWLRSALWLGGLTSIWLASLSYLRVVYIEAQRRFLLRGRLAASVSSTWRERLTDSMPTLPSMPSFRLRRPSDDDEDTDAVRKDTVRKNAETEVPRKRRFGLPSFMKRKPLDATDESTIKMSAKDRLKEQPPEKQPPEKQQAERMRAEQVKAEQQRAAQRPTTQPASQSQGFSSHSSGPSSSPRPSTSAAQGSSAAQGNSAAPRAPLAARQANATLAKPADDETSTEEKSARRSWFSRLVSKPNMNNDAAEYRKVDRATRAAGQAEAKKEKQRLYEEQRQAKKTAAANKKSADGEATPKRGWLPKISVPKIKMPALPKFKLPSLRLPPPSSSDSSASSPANKTDARPLPPNRPLPSTNGPTQEAMQSGARPLSKAERKRMRRNQDGQDYDEEDRRAA